MRLTISKKGLLLIAVPLMFQLAFVALLVRILAEADDAQQWALHTKEVISKAEGAFGQLALVQGASRGYVVSRMEPFADDARVAMDSARKQFADLDQIVADNAQQQQRAKAVRAAADVVMTWYQGQIDLVRSGKQQEALDRFNKMEGRSRLQALRADLDTFVGTEQKLDAERTAHLAQVRTAEQWVIGGGTLGMLAAAIGAAYAFGRNIGARLSVVTANAERLAENQPLASPVSGDDEIARLDAVVHESSRRLIAADAATAQHREELDRRAAELARTNESLRQQTQENEMFVYSVSHDLRSPLVNLQGFSKELEHAGSDLKGILADDRVPADIRAKATEVMAVDMADSLRFIRTAVIRSSGIIDSLLRLSRARRVEYRPASVDVTTVVARVVDAMRGSITDRQADVVVGDLLPAWGDPTAIEQVFGNLVGNAVNYLDSSRPGRVEVGMVDGGKVGVDGLRTYFVKDNGLGIPAAYIAKVFVAFQRLHGDVAKGEGIGLALVRRVVERHAGRAWVESTEKVGTTFFVALPATAPAAGEADPVGMKG